MDWKGSKASLIMIFHLVYPMFYEVSQQKCGSSIRSLLVSGMAWSEKWVTALFGISGELDNSCNLLVLSVEECPVICLPQIYF